MRMRTSSPVWTFTARIRTLSRAVSTRRSKCGSVVKERRRRGRRVCIIYVCAFDSFVPASYYRTELKLRAVVSTLTVNETIGQWIFSHINQCNSLHLEIIITAVVFGIFTGFWS
uniref:Uncharacterized protein n=1 Tax=Cacopsylla melanoneura TaxID=428564 RepID=A0A8D8WF04_9HEMI